MCSYILQLTEYDASGLVEFLIVFEVLFLRLLSQNADILRPI